MFLDAHPDPFAVAVEQNSDHEEAPTASNDRAQDEEPDVIAGKARGNSHELVGDRCQTLADDDQGAPFGIGCTEGFDLAAEAIKFDQPMPEGIIKQRTDGIAENAAQ